jgi:hypothetical protein
MGFNKRIVNKQSIILTDEDRIDKLFNADALILDKWASSFLQLYIKGYKKDEIINMLENGSTES